MDARPVRRQGVPGYPTRLEVAADPDLLRTRLPPAWLTRAEMAGAAGLLLAANMAGCDTTKPTSEPAGGPPATPPVATAPAVASNTPAATPDWPAVVAPIFEHGDGRGATGCVVVAAPVFLSEEEALQVIQEELTAHGLVLSERNVQLAKATTVERREEFDIVGNQVIETIAEVPGSAKPLTIDLKDPGWKVAVEYVSGADYFELGGPRSCSTAQDYDFKELAQVLSAEVKRKEKGIYFGVFYDPVTRLDMKAFMKAIADARKEDPKGGIGAAWERATSPLKTEAKRLLRQQVRDFAEWLMAQTAI